jgi:hypothetical protein
MSQYFKTLGEDLVRAGYPIVPLPLGSKGPRIKNWPNLRLSVEDVQRMAANGSAQAGVGVIAATCPAIDVDILDDVVADAMNDAIDVIFEKRCALTRTGKAPKFLVPFRSDTPFRKMSSNTYTDGTNEHKVEILGDGQQWVAYHIHPDTGKPYVWYDGLSDDGIVGVRRADLPELTPDHARSVIDAFELLAAEKVRCGDWRAASRTANASQESASVESDPFASQPTNLTRSQIEWLLGKQDVNGYKSWIDAGMALHHQFNGEDEGFDIWDAWSANGHTYDETVMRTHWDSFGSGKHVPQTMRSLLDKHGQPPKKQTLETDRSFQFYKGSEYAEDFIGGPEIVEDVFPAQGTGMMFGPSGSGKTFWMLDLAFHVQNGVQWRDKDVAQGDVMYIAAEAGRGIKKRIRGVLNAHPGWTAPFFADMAPDLSDVEWIKTIRDAAQAAGRPSMVVIDTMSASFAGDDSSQADVAPMIRNLTSLSMALECLVVFVHHTTKEGTSWRGSGAFFADVDAVLELVTSGEGNTRKQHIVQRKHRDGEAGKEYPFDLVVTESLGTKPNGKHITTMVVEQSTQRAAPKKAGKEGTNARLLREVYAEIDKGLGEVTAADLLDAAGEKFGKGFRRDNYRRSLAGMIGFEGACLPYETVIYL